MSATRSRPSWLIITLMCAVSIASALQYMLLVPLLPVLPDRLHASPNDVAWLVTGSILAGTVASPILTRIADMTGRRLLLLVCLGFIGLGAMIALLTDDVWALVAARSISGMSAASVPIGIAIMRATLPPDRRALGIGLVSTTGGVGVGVALPLGGLINDAFGWHGIFWFMLALAAVLALALPAVVADDPERVRGRFDALGAVLLGVALTAALLATSKGAEWGWLTWPVLSLYGLAVVLGAIWLWHERRVPTPLVDLRVTTTSSIVVANVVSLAFGFTMFGNILVMTSQLQVPEDAGGFGLSAVAASALLAIPAFTIMIAAPAASFLVPRAGGRTMLIAGGALTAAGYAVRWAFPGDLSWIVIGSVVIQLGSSAGLAAMSIVISANAPVAETASANGINVLIRSIGSTFAAATVAAAFTLVATSPSGVVVPSPGAFAIFFAIATCCGVVAFAGALWLPRGRSEAMRLAEPDQASGETTSIA